MHKVSAYDTTIHNVYCDDDVTYLTSTGCEAPVSLAVSRLMLAINYGSEAGLPITVRCSRPITITHLNGQQPHFFIKSFN